MRTRSGAVLATRSAHSAPETALPSEVGDPISAASLTGRRSPARADARSGAR